MNTHFSKQNLHILLFDEQKRCSLFNLPKVQKKIDLNLYNLESIPAKDYIIVLIVFNIRKTTYVESFRIESILYLCYKT